MAMIAAGSVRAASMNQPLKTAHVRTGSGSVTASPMQPVCAGMSEPPLDSKDSV